jgi:hypothetical protein
MTNFIGRTAPGCPGTANTMKKLEDYVFGREKVSMAGGRLERGEKCRYAMTDRRYDHRA